MLDWIHESQGNDVNYTWRLIHVSAQKSKCPRRSEDDREFFLMCYLCPCPSLTERVFFYPSHSPKMLGPRLFLKRFFIISIRFGLFIQSQRFYARKATESVVPFPAWVHELSERYPAQNPRGQFELLPTSQSLPRKISSSSKSKNKPIFEQEKALYFVSFLVGLNNEGKSSTYASRETEFWARYLSERLRHAYGLISSVYRPKTDMNVQKKGVKIEPNKKSDPHKNRPTEVRINQKIPNEEKAGKTKIRARRSVVFP